MKNDPKRLAEEHDRKMYYLIIKFNVFRYLEGIKQEEQKWIRQQSEENLQKHNNINMLK